MSTTVPSIGVPSPVQGNAGRFDQNLNIAKSSKTIADYLRQEGKSAIHAKELSHLADNTKGSVPTDVSAAAAYLVAHPDVYTAIETHDVPGADGLSGVWNFDWAAKGGLEGTAVEAIAAMQDAFDRAIGQSAKITEITTGKKTELDATKQRPSN